MNRHPLRIAAAASAVVAALLLAACSSPLSTSTVAAAPGASFAALSLRNCGFQLTVPSPPQRVVTIKSTSTEMLLALGLQDRIVGTAFSDGPVPDQWATAASGLTSLSDQVPSEEATLALKPDFIYGGWESAFAPDGVGARDELASLGIGSYVSPAACRSADVPAKLSFDDVFQEIDEVGRIFGVEDRAQALVDQQKAALASVTPDTRGLTALWYSSGEDEPYVGAGHGAPEMMMEALGVKNVAADLDGAWSSLGWEAVIAANPDVIILPDASWNTAQYKINALESNPATAKLDAVKNHRFLTIPFASSEAGVRNVEAVQSLSQQLAALSIP